MNRDQIREGVDEVIGRAQEAANDVFRGARSKAKDQAERAAHGAEEVAGWAQEAAGDALRHARSRVKKQTRRAAHRAEDAYGAALDSLEDAARDQPLKALAVALVIGFIAGLWAVRN